MGSFSFNDYYIKRQFRELATYCEKNSLDLQPMVDFVQEVVGREDLSKEEKFDEIVQTVKNIAGGAANMANNLAGWGSQKAGQAVGGAVGFAQNQGSNFKQGYQQAKNAMAGYGAQNQPQQPAGATAGGMPNAQPAGSGQQQQAPQGQQGNVQQQIQNLHQALGTVTNTTSQMGQIIQQLMQHQ